MPRIAVREAAYAAIAAHLTAVLAGIPLERNRRSLINQGDGPCLVLRDGNQDLRPDGAGEDRFVMEAVLEGYVEADDATVGPAINALYARAAEALISQTILLADGLTEIFIEEGRTEVVVETVANSEEPVGAFYLDFSFDLRVPVGTRFLDTP